MEQASNVPMAFAIKSINHNSHFKNSSKRKSQKKHLHRKVHGQKVRCNYCWEVGHVTPHCHAMKILVPKGLMRWIPEQWSTNFTNPKDPTCIGDLNLT